jgi:hypothetical protein
MRKYGTHASTQPKSRDEKSVAVRLRYLWSRGKMWSGPSVQSQSEPRCILGSLWRDQAQQNWLPDRVKRSKRHERHNGGSLVLAVRATPHEFRRNKDDETRRQSVTTRGEALRPSRRPAGLMRPAAHETSLTVRAPHIALAPLVIEIHSDH